MQAALDSGEVDVIPNMGMIPGRDYLFTTPVGTFDISVFVRKASLNVSEPRDVRGRVAVIETNVGESLVNDLGATEVVVYHDVREGLFRLVSGDVDALIFAAPVTWALARKAGIDHQIKELSPPLTEVKRAMAVSLSRADLSTRLNRAMESFVGISRVRRDLQAVACAARAVLERPPGRLPWPRRARGRGNRRGRLEVHHAAQGR